MLQILLRRAAVLNNDTSGTSNLEKSATFASVCMVLNTYPPIIVRYDLPILSVWQKNGENNNSQTETSKSQKQGQQKETTETPPTHAKHNPATGKADSILQNQLWGVGAKKTSQRTSYSHNPRMDECPHRHVQGRGHRYQSSTPTETFNKKFKPISDNELFQFRHHHIFHDFQDGSYLVDDEFLDGCLSDEDFTFIDCKDEEKKIVIAILKRQPPNLLRR